MSPPLPGIYASFRIKIPFPDRFMMIRDAGFDATCVWWDDADGDMLQLRNSIPDLVRDAGLILDNVHVPYRKCTALWSADDAEREQIVQQHIGWVEDCARFNIPRLVMHVIILSREPEMTSKGIDSVRRIVEAGEAHDVTICIENTRRPGEITTLLDAIDSPNLGLCFDTSHDRLYSETPKALLDKHQDRLEALHLSDTDGILDRHWLPGEGTIDFDQFQENFSVVKPDVPLMLEVVSWQKDEAPTDFLHRAYDSLVSHCLPSATD